MLVTLSVFVNYDPEFYIITIKVIAYSIWKNLTTKKNNYFLCGCIKVCINKNATRRSVYLFCGKIVIWLNMYNVVNSNNCYWMYVLFLYIPLNIYLYVMLNVCINRALGYVYRQLFTLLQIAIRLNIVFVLNCDSMLNSLYIIEICFEFPCFNWFYSFFLLWIFQVCFVNLVNLFNIFVVIKIWISSFCCCCFPLSTKCK